MKKYAIAFAIFAAGFFTQSCATFNNLFSEKTTDAGATLHKSEFASVKGLTSEEKMAVLEAYLDNLIQSVENDDFANYFKAFMPEQKSNLKEDAFKERNKAFREQCGKYISRTFIGVLQKQLFNVYLWKARYSKLPEDDILLKLFVIEEDGQLKIYAFNIQPF